jgi:hypothetical protein
VAYGIEHRAIVPKRAWGKLHSQRQKPALELAISIMAQFPTSGLQDNYDRIPDRNATYTPWVSFELDDKTPHLVREVTRPGGGFRYRCRCPEQGHRPSGL